MKKRMKFLPLLLGGLLVLAGCDNFTPNWPMESINPEDLSIDTPWVDNIVPCTEISFAKGENNLNLKKGDTHQFVYAVEPRDATLSALTWESDNPNVATVSNSGLLTAVGGGKANISLSGGEVKARALVTVTVPIVDFVITNQTLDLDYGESVQLNTTFSPEDTTQKSLTYEAVGTGFTVSSTGLVTALNANADGQIRVTNEAMNKVETVTVHVSDKYNYISSFTLGTSTPTIEVSKGGTISAEIIGIDPSAPASTLKNHSVTYSVKEGSEDLISIDADTGAFTALEPGTATIVGSILDERNNHEVSDEIEIEIFEVSASALTLSETGTIELDNKDNTELPLTITYTCNDPERKLPSRGNLETFSSDNTVVKLGELSPVEDEGHNIIAYTTTLTAVGLGTNNNGLATITVRDTKYNVSTSVDVHTTMYAKAIQISQSGPFYLDEKMTITANVSPAKTTDNLVWVYDDTTGHTFEEDGNKLTITCENLEHPVEVKATITTGGEVTTSNVLTLEPIEREVEFENGKVYIVGSANYKTGVSKSAGVDGSWSKAKYAFTMSDKTGKAGAKYEYKATIEFRENDLWKIRRNASEWCDTDCYTKDKDPNYKLGYYKLTEGAFAADQMGVASGDNIIVKQAGKYDIYYAFFENEHPEGWFEVYVEEHGMKLSSTSVHAKLTTPEATISTITASNYEGTLRVEDVDTDYITVSPNQSTGVISITPVAIGVTSFKVCDNVKNITVNVEVKAGSSAAAISLYVRGTASNGWTDVSDDYVLRVSSDANNIGEILDVYLSQGDFKIANADWSEEYGWDYDNRSTIAGGAASKFAAGSSDNNIHCNVAGYYNIYLTTNHYIFIDSVGGDEPENLSSYYVRGTAVGGWEAIPANQMQTDDNPNNLAIIEGIHLDVGEFKIANADWTEEYGWDYDSRSTIIGGAAANFAAGTSNNNIKCNVAGDYNIYLTVDHYISIEVASSGDPVFSLSTTSATIESGDNTVVTASNVTGTLAYVVNTGSADVVTSGTGTITVTITSTNVGTNTITFSDDSTADPIVFTLTVEESEDPGTTKRVYFETKSFFNDGSENQNVLAYLWNSSNTSVNNNWPGVATTWLKNIEDDKKIFYIDVDTSVYDSVIFVRTVNGNVELKTADISITTSLTDKNTVYLDANSWSGSDVGITVGFYNGTY